MLTSLQMDKLIKESINFLFYIQLEKNLKNIIKLIEIDKFSKRV